MKMSCFGIFCNSDPRTVVLRKEAQVIQRKGGGCQLFDRKKYVLDNDILYGYIFVKFIEWGEAMKKSTHSSREFLSLIRRWQKLEDTTIKNAQALINKTSSSLVKTTMEMIKHDSEKHKVVLQAIIDSITKEAAYLSPDELASLAGMLNKHLEIEANSVALASEAFKDCKLFATSYLLSALLDDETKHHRMIVQLTDDLKRASISTSTGARRSKGE